MGGLFDGLLSGWLAGQARWSFGCEVRNISLVFSEEAPW
jgi:hypothetical protein